MKRPDFLQIFIFVTLLIFSSGLAAAQETEQDAAVKESAAGKFSLTCGGFASVEPAAGDLSQYVTLNAGGGLACQAGFSLPVMKMEIGPVVRLGFGNNFLKDDRLLSMVNLSAAAGVFLRIPLGESGFSLCPELDYGAGFYLAKANPEYLNWEQVTPCYIDQLLQAGLGLRYKSEKVLKGRLEFEIMPVYIFSPETERTVHFIGATAGAYYRFLEK